MHIHIILTNGVSAAYRCNTRHTYTRYALECVWQQHSFVHIYSIPLHYMQCTRGVSACTHTSGRVYVSMHGRDTHVAEQYTGEVNKCIAFTDRRCAHNDDERAYTRACVRERCISRRATVFARAGACTCTRARMHTYAPPCAFKQRWRVR